MDNLTTTGNNHHRIGPTADLVAHYRRYADQTIPFSEYIAEKIGAKEVAVEILGGENNLSEDYLAAIFEVRYKVVDEHIARSPYRKRQIEIGSGSSPRGFKNLPANWG